MCVFKFVFEKSAKLQCVNRTTFPREIQQNNSPCLSIRHMKRAPSTTTCKCTGVQFQSFDFRLCLSRTNIALCGRIERFSSTRTCPELIVPLFAPVRSVWPRVTKLLDARAAFRDLPVTSRVSTSRPSSRLAPRKSFPPISIGVFKFRSVDLNRTKAPDTSIWAAI